MPNYRRAYIPGGTYFFTLTLADRSSRILLDHIAALRLSWREVRQVWPFAVHAVAILPDHMHLVMKLPDGEADFSTRLRLFKAGFTRRLPEAQKLEGRKGERRVWQARFWEHVVRDEDELARCIDYVHHNPVKHGYVAHPGDWLYSSFGRRNLDWQT